MPDLAAAIFGTIPTEFAAVAIGVVTGVGASTSGRVSVNIDGGTLDLPYLKTYVPALNDPVFVIRQGARAWVVSSLKSNATAGGPVTPPIVTPPTPETPPSSGTATFSTTGAASYRSGSRRTDTSDLFQGDWTGRGNNTGVWTYGGAPKATLSGKRARAGRIWMRRGAGGAGAATAPALGAVTDTSLPAGTPTVTGVANMAPLLIGQGAWLDIGIGNAQALIDGTAGGLGITASGTAQYLSVNGPPSDGQSGTIQIDWTTG